MRYALQIVDGVELVSGHSPLPPGAIEPVTNWEDLIDLPYYYRKVVGGQVVEKTQAEKDAYDQANPPTLEELQEEAQMFLDDTDWYVIRQHDDSSLVPVPGDVTTARGEAREIL